MIKLRQVFFDLLLSVVASAVAAPCGQWGTERATLEPFDLTPGSPAVAPSKRIWIGTDAASSATTLTDPDDCLAILWLMERGADMIGISTSLGNALHDVVAKRTAALVAQMALDKLLIPPVFLGHGAPSASGASKPPGVSALQAAIKEGAPDHSGAWPVDQNENEA